MEIVIDCSVSASWFFPDEISEASEKILESIISQPDFSLLQPSIWLYETVNCLRTAVLRKRLTNADARKALFQIHELPINYISPMQQGEFNILNDALENKLSAYDAAYFNLAETRGIKLVTGDKDLLGVKKNYPFIFDINEFNSL